MTSTLRLNQRIDLSSSQLFWSIVLTPLATLWSDALDDMHSDYLVATFITVDNPSFQALDRIIYWPQYLLFWSWDLNVTTRILAALRVWSLVYCWLWIARLVSSTAMVARWKTSAFMGIFVWWWAMTWPEVGDSSIYSGNTLSLAPFLLASSIGFDQERRTHRLVGLVVICSTTLLAASTNVLSLLIVFPLLTCGYLNRFLLVLRDQSFRCDWFSFSHGQFFAGVAGLSIGVLRLVFLTSENSGFSSFGLLSRILYTTHLWDGTKFLRDNLVISIGLLVLSLLLALRVRHVRLAVLSLTGALMSMSTGLIVGLEHVQTNLMMPRYFSLTFSIGLALQVVAFGVLVLLQFPKLDVKTVSASRTLQIRTWQLATAGLTSFVVTLPMLMFSEIKFGKDYKDHSGSSKAGFVLPRNDLEWLKTKIRNEEQQVMVLTGFWDLWPQVFALRRDGLESIALEDIPRFSNLQSDLGDALGSDRSMVVCISREPDCVTTTRDALEAHDSVNRDLTVRERYTTEDGRFIWLIQNDHIPS